MERHDASSGEWSAMTAMSTARKSFAACVLGGEFHVIGGHDSNEMILNSVEKYSLESDTWCAVAPLPVGGGDHATVVVGSVMYILGGETDEGLMASVLKFDGADGTWSDVAHMPAPRGGFTSCAYMNDI
jgi:kelch-like protein 9/13